MQGRRRPRGGESHPPAQARPACVDVPAPPFLRRGGARAPARRDAHEAPFCMHSGGSVPLWAQGAKGGSRRQGTTTTMATVRRDETPQPARQSRGRFQGSRIATLMVSAVARSRFRLSPLSLLSRARSEPAKYAAQRGRSRCRGCAKPYCIMYSRGLASHLASSASVLLWHAKTTDTGCDD